MGIMMQVKNSKNKGIGWGFLIGTVSPWIIMPLFIVLYAKFENYGVDRLWHDFFHYNKTMSRILSLCMIGNLLWFYIFLNKERYGIAKGVILGTLLYFPLFIYLIYF